jgi:hypothetical protein
VSGSEARPPLGRLPFLRSVAWRLPAESHPVPSAVRAAEGWERRFVADGARSEEMMDFYRDLGFEVLADPVAAADLPGGCESCLLVRTASFRVIYTRKPRPARQD